MTTKQLIPLAPSVSRRRFVLGASAALAASAMPASRGALAQKAPQDLKVPVLTGTEIELAIGHQEVNLTGRKRLATTFNNSLPGPTLRFKEGERATIRVTNNLPYDSSIHWHGILLPSEMDGVPGLSFGGIKPGETFTYHFDLVQSGTYWYHSHSGFQEQTGLYGALVVEPKEPEPFEYDRDHVIVLSDWTDEDPHDVYAKLKKMSHYYNFNERTVADWWRDVQDKGFLATWRDRKMWNQMRMSDTDIADVTAHTYTYLMNGVTPDRGWLGLIERGEKVRLRFINASAMSIFDVRIPGLKMTVVASDGQAVQPVTVDEFRIGTAETYDVIVEPEDDQAYTLFAQSIDRTGYTRGTLTPDAALLAEIPDMDPAPILTHRDMGMDHSAMGHGKMDHGAMNHEGMGHEGMDHGEVNHERMNHQAMDHEGMDHSAMGHGAMKREDMGHDVPAGKSSGEAKPVVNPHHEHETPVPPNMPATSSDHPGGHGMQMLSVKTTNLARAGFGSSAPVKHVRTEFGPHVDSRADAPVDGITDPGIGLREHQALYGRRVLTYADLRNYYPTADRRQPEREIQIHLTGNMGRYMWSMNGIKHAEAAPIELRYGERVRIILVNDTMMTHPIHLHGLWSELETGDPDHIPKKHTVLVQPGAKVSYLVTADARGRWAYHCHLLFHMPGMMREVRVI